MYKVYFNVVVRLVDYLSLYILFFLYYNLYDYR